jgi:outer membrane lipoprotein carrier protein
MKFIFLSYLLVTSLFADFLDINSFRANFKQIVTDEDNKTLVYTGMLQAKKPQFALWFYKTPIKKSIYIRENRVIVIEPELEQVIVKDIPADFDFFHMLHNAKQINSNMYIATINSKKYTINLSNGIVSSLVYSDDFGNSVQILFSEQFQNTDIKETIFKPIIPSEYDIIQG